MHPLASRTASGTGPTDTAQQLDATDSAHEHQPVVFHSQAAALLPHLTPRQAQKAYGGVRAPHHLGLASDREGAGWRVSTLGVIISQTTYNSKAPTQPSYLPAKPAGRKQSHLFWTRVIARGGKQYFLQFCVKWKTCEARLWKVSECLKFKKCCLRFKLLPQTATTVSLSPTLAHSQELPPGVRLR